jgi:hypothetical protein
MRWRCHKRKMVAKATLREGVLTPPFDAICSFCVSGVSTSSIHRRLHLREEAGRHSVEVEVNGAALHLPVPKRFPDDLQRASSLSDLPEYFIQSDTPQSTTKNNEKPRWPLQIGMIEYTCHSKSITNEVKSLCHKAFFPTSMKKKKPAAA